MNTELNLSELLNQFLDDLDGGVTPRIYDLIASDPDAIEDLIPLLDLISLARASTAQIPIEKKQNMKSYLLTLADKTAQEWSMQRLIEEGEPEVVARGDTLGLTPTQLKAISTDTTPVNLDNPKEVVRQLAKKYQLGRVQFAGLLNWILQLTASLGPHNNTSMVYARSDENKKKNASESKG